jgi:hypothetical protein
MHSTFDPAILIPERCGQAKYLHNAPATERPDLCAPSDEHREACGRAERRLSGAVPVYAAPDQDVCGVDMSLNSVHAIAT